MLEYERTHLECILIPINDPTMKVEWFKDGMPLLHGISSLFFLHFHQVNFIAVQNLEIIKTTILNLSIN